MIDQLMGLLDKPRNMAFSAMGSKDGSGAGLLQALLGVDPNSTAGQVGGTVADIGLDPLNLVGAGVFNGARKAGRLGVLGARAAEGDRAMDALKGVTAVAGGEPALAGKLTDAATMGGGRNPLLAAIGEGGGGGGFAGAKADLQLSGVPSLPDGMGGFAPSTQGGMALPEFAGAALDGPAVTVDQYRKMGRAPTLTPADEFFGGLGPKPAIADPLPPPTASALSDPARVAVPGGVGKPNVGDLPPPGGMAPQTVQGPPAAFSEWQVNGDNPLRISASAPPAGPGPRDRGLLRGDETLAPNLQGGVGMGPPPDIQAMLQDIDPMLLSEIMAAAVGGGTAGRAGTQPFLQRPGG